MILLSASDDCLLLKFRSDITFVDVAVQIIGNLLDYLGIEDPTNILLVSRELPKNAVVHGDHNRKNKEVVFRSFRISQDRFRLEIEDSCHGICRMVVITECLSFSFGHALHLRIDCSSNQYSSRGL